jgi:hypothetical protein
MKKIIFALLCIAAVCSSASIGPLITVTGYPAPCPIGQPKCRPYSKAVTITDAEGRSVDPAKPPQKGKLYQLEFKIPIEKFKDDCGGLKPENFQVGYGFQNSNGSTGSSEPPGRSDGKLQSFSVSIVEEQGRKLYDGVLLSAGTPDSEQKVRAKIYTLPKEAARFLKPRNTLVLRAMGFENIYVGLWCSAVQ